MAMQGRLWLVSLVIWGVLVAALLSVGDGGPVTGTAAAVGVALAVANARWFTRKEPSPLIEGNSAVVESLMGLALVTVAVAGAMGWTPVLLGCAAVALGAVGYLLWTRAAG